MFNNFLKHKIEIINLQHMMKYHNFELNGILVMIFDIKSHA